MEESVRNAVRLERLREDTKVFAARCGKAEGPPGCTKVLAAAYGKAEASFAHSKRFARLVALA
jgi:hypothetical protein